MAEFKKGDRVRLRAGGAFSNEEYVITVDKVIDDTVWLKETRTWIIADVLCHDEPKMRGASLMGSSRSLPKPDAVDQPPHYARWPMQPVEFAAVNNLPWWLFNIYKYTMRHDAKDGLQDLYKARSYLNMKIRELEGVERWWEAPVSEERKLNGIHQR